MVLSISSVEDEEPEGSGGGPGGEGGGPGAGLEGPGGEGPGGGLGGPGSGLEGLDVDCEGSGVEPEGAGVEPEYLNSKLEVPSEGLGLAEAASKLDSFPSVHLGCVLEGLPDVARGAAPASGPTSKLFLRAASSSSTLQSGSLDPSGATSGGGAMVTGRAALCELP